jgi:hypothetical protein
VRSAAGWAFAPALFFLGFAALRAAEAPRIEWRTEAASRVIVEVSGVTPATLHEAEPSTLLRVFAEQPSATATMPAITGTWSVGGGGVRFEPQFPLERGVRYRAEFRSGPGAAIVSLFELPKPKASPSTVVLQISPSADVLPENQLKFYVQFSAPMRRGEAYAHVRLHDAADRPIELPFLELDEELWDPAMTRLTLLIDPGRIKRGVKPLQDVGPVFEEGKSYTLAVAAEWRDAAGQPLRESFEKKFRIGPADRVPPDPRRWKLRPVQAETHEPLVVDFDEPMDRALALRLITVTDAASRPLAGETTLGVRELRWSFVPAEPWRAGAHALVVATTIEDLAGNNIGKPFDVDLFEGIQRRVGLETLSLPFSVK